MPTVYPSLRIGAPRRLALFKAEAQRPDWVRPLTWRDVRFATLKSAAGLSQGSNGPAPVWFTHDGPAFERERFADEVQGGPEHRGWFTDSDGRAVARGLVVALPHGRHLAGYLWTDNGERVYFGELHDDERDAAREADRLAERFADEAREDSDRYDAARKLEQDTEDAAHRLRECLALRNHPRHLAARDEARDLLETIRANRARLAAEFADYI